jgi:hypothetical protein
MNHVFKMTLILLKCDATVRHYEIYQFLLPVGVVTNFEEVSVYKFVYNLKKYAKNDGRVFKTGVPIEFFLKTYHF